MMMNLSKNKKMVTLMKKTTSPDRSMPDGIMNRLRMRMKKVMAKKRKTLDRP